MLTNKLQNLFDSYDPAIKSIILDVLKVEQANISYDKPRVKDDIDSIVSSVAASEVAKAVSE